MFPSPIQRLIDLFLHLPGVGPRQAARFAFQVLEEPQSFRDELADAVYTVADAILACNRCGNIEAKAVEHRECSICRDRKRDQTRIAVVEQIVELRAIERTRAYTGLYHVLQGSTDMRDEAQRAAGIAALAIRIKAEHTEECIIATSPTYDGDYTARRIEKALEGMVVRVTHLGRGLAKGVDLEYVDEETMKEALEGRR